MTEECLRKNVENGIAKLEMNTPFSINALSETMLSALIEELDTIAQSDDIRVVILASTGDHFCAGHDLKEMNAHRDENDGGHQYYNKLFSTCSSLMQRIVNLPQPVIAEVKGIATAAGCQLVASCDLAVASEEARFATSGINVGLFCSTPMVALSRAIAPKLALEMLLTGEFIDAGRAERIGLINQVAPLHELENATLSIAKTIAEKSNTAIKIGKRAFYEQIDMELAQAYDFASKVMADNMICQDAEDGINAFVGKRPMPKWNKR